jgi:hypothetical protein
LEHPLYKEVPPRRQEREKANEEEKEEYKKKTPPYFFLNNLSLKALLLGVCFSQRRRRGVSLRT